VIGKNLIMNKLTETVKTFLKSYQKTLLNDKNKTTRFNIVSDDHEFFAKDTSGVWFKNIKTQEVFYHDTVDNFKIALIDLL
jgi:hypothetical protein